MARITPSIQWLRHGIQTLVVLGILASVFLASPASEFPIQGNTWAAEVFGAKIIDPLAGAESMAASRTLRWSIIIAIAVPFVLTVLLGRVFCSWVCPAGFLFELTDKLRGALARLGIPVRDTRLWRGTKFVFLGIGLAMSALFALPLLGSIYPPSLIVREIHGGVLTGATLFLLMIALVEVAFSPRLWCRYLCPGGALYTLLGRFRLVRVQRNLTACTDCAKCVPACGMGLNPMQDRTGMECDNCQACISSCPDDALALVISPVDRPPRITR